MIDGDNGRLIRAVSGEFTPFDEKQMRRALALARRGRGLVEPNPMVGCVIVRGKRVVGEGYHTRYGWPHAEVEALKAAGSASRGGTAYVTLEPCCHIGKTGPCTDALMAGGVSRVVAAMVDPFEAVSGKGLAILSRAGVKVEVGLLGEEAAELNAPFVTRVVHGRPYVIAKWAQSLDGKIATRKGDSQWISCEASRRDVHRIRGVVDAVIVGVNTVLADDPMLTARGVRVCRVASRIVVDSRLRMPTKCKLVDTAGEYPTSVLTTATGGRSRKRKTLERLGVEVIVCREKVGRVSLVDAMKRLGGRGMTSVMVEGGGELIGGLMDAGVVDEARVYTAPLIIGGRDGVSSCSGEGVALVKSCRTIATVERKRFDRDELTVLRFSSPVADVAQRVGRKSSRG